MADTPVINGALGGIYLGYGSVSLIPGNAEVSVEISFVEYVAPPETGITFPMTLGAGSCAASGTVSSGVLYVSEINADALQAMLYAENAPETLSMDLTIFAEDVSTLTLPRRAFQAIAQAANDPASAISGMCVHMKDGSVYFDAVSLAAIARQTSGSTMQLHLDAIGAEALNTAQRRAVRTLEPLYLMEVYVSSGGQHITDFDGGCLRVSVPTADRSPGYAVHCVRPDGALERMTSASRQGSTSWLCYHLSEYVLSEDTTKCAFSDVQPDSYYNAAVTWALQNSITTGVSSGEFLPDACCTRAQMLTLLWRAAGCPASGIRSSGFSDVPASSYYADAVLWAVEHGITQGTSATTFSPDATVTRAQAVTFLYRFTNARTGSVALPFEDVPAGAYYHNAVQWAYQSGITKGTGDTAFSPNAPCTRAQAVTLLYRCF